jgi:hypothetical protein
MNAPDPNALTKREVDKLVCRYIGVASGYLGDFRYRTHAPFYAEDCELEVDPGQARSHPGMRPPLLAALRRDS